MYVGHKNTNLQNVPPPLCKFMSGHNFDISFHLPLNVPLLITEKSRMPPPHAAAAAFVARHRSPTPPPRSPKPHATAAAADTFADANG